jgi:hypothetical protein
MAQLVLALVRDLLFSSRIGETTRHVGCAFRAARTLGEFEGALVQRPDLILVDLTAQELDLDAALSAVDTAGRPAPVLGWTTHALWRETKPRHARCDRVVTRETLTEQLPELLRSYLAAPAHGTQTVETTPPVGPGSPAGEPGD